MEPSSGRKKKTTEQERSTATCGVWGDMDDWHTTLDLIAMRWGAPSSSFSSFASSSSSSRAGHGATGRDVVSADPRPTPRGNTTEEGEGGKEEPHHAHPTEEEEQEHAATKEPHHAPSSPPSRTNGGSATTVSSASTGVLGKEARAKPSMGRAGDGEGDGAGPVVSRKQRYGGRSGAVSLPRPSDVEALLRKATKETNATQKRQRASAPHPASELPSASSSPASSSSDDSDASASAPPKDGSASAYSAARDLRNAFVSVNQHAAGGVPNNEGLVLSLQELQKRPVPPTLNKAALETYLSDDEFSSALGMPRDQFYSLRAWKQTQVKKKAGLL